MYWDGEEKPAVSAPLGDFFGVGLGRTATFENALFANPEGRSFNSFIQMPFRRSARIEIVNELDYPLGMLFYDVDLQLLDRWDDSYLYFHCFWHRDTSTVLARDFEILPHVEGKGRFLGTNVSVVSDPVYENAWWGEGEVKVYLNGDTDFATLVGTGTEDYIGTAWGQGAYTTMYTGCPVADDANRQWAYYRYHIKDPVYFKTDCRVTVQVMGGSSKQHVMDLLEKGAGLLPVQIIHENGLVNFYREDTIQDLRDPAIPAEGWVNFYRSDDYAAAAYFYLDRPSNGLPDLQGLEVRTWNLK